MVINKEVHPMQKFNWNKILQPNTVVHCDTEEKANELLGEADSRGLKWSSGLDYANTQWNDYREKICYNLYSGGYYGLNYYKSQNYTILSYEDALIKGENKMTKINKNYYKDGLRVTYEDDYIRIFKQFESYKLFDLFIGKDNLTFEQANEMLKPFGIIIEPKSTDWSKVEVGTELKFADGRTQYKTTFYQYVEDTKQILVIENSYVKV